MVLSLAAIPPDQKAGQITTEDISKLAALLKAIPLTPDGLLGFDWAIVTAGGVDLKEVDPRTMQSKLVKNLYIAGSFLTSTARPGGSTCRCAGAPGTSPERARPWLMGKTEEFKKTERQRQKEAFRRRRKASFVSMQGKHFPAVIPCSPCSGQDQAYGWNIRTHCRTRP
ncbi:hypothetical protein MASR2M79_10520 [Aminivibrio sp.]